MLDLHRQEASRALHMTEALPPATRLCGAGEQVLGNGEPQLAARAVVRRPPRHVLRQAPVEGQRQAHSVVERLHLAQQRHARLRYFSTAHQRVQAHLYIIPCVSRCQVYLQSHTRARHAT
jgi:hypothetical protein